jgi:hypothetical protein
MKVGSRFMSYLVSRKRITPESSLPSSSSPSWCGRISSKGSCVEDGGAEKLPLLCVAVLEDAQFFFMARSHGGSQSLVWWKEEGRARFEYCGVA